jgi:NTE family protein
VEVQGNDPHHVAYVEKMLESNVGNPVSADKLEQDLSRIVGMGRYASLNYQMIQKEGKDGRVIEGEEKTYAPPLLQPGVFIDGSQYNDVQFAVGARLTFLDLGGFRSEWQTDITLSNVRRGNCDYTCIRQYDFDEREFCNRHWTGDRTDLAHHSELG